jgi:transposase
LDAREPEWRKDTVLLLDNASIHHTDEVKKAVRDNRLPIFFTAPASFDVLPVELVFSRVKRIFSKVYVEKVQRYHDIH